MTAISTEDMLRALNKILLTEMFLKLQEHTTGTISSLAEEMKTLNENFKKLKSDVAVAKNVNNMLSKQMVSGKPNAGKMPNTLLVSVSKW